MSHTRSNDSEKTQIVDSEIDCMFTVHDDIGVSRGHLRRGIDRATLLKLFAGAWVDVSEQKIDEFISMARQVQIDVIIESSSS